ncbi:MAG: septum formation initiator family protein [Rhodospirillales bacterium]|nr:septum formation initiator family protein [Rhodospirillales bacterium]
MSILQELARRAPGILPPLLGALAFSYFAYHAVEGDRGLRSWLKLRQEIATARSTEAELAAERAVLERRVALLRPESLDRDMLEERARAVLNLAHPDERVILQNDAP